MPARSPERILYVEGNRDGTIGGSYYSLLFLVSGLDRQRFEPIVAFARDSELIPRFQVRDVRTFIDTPPSPRRWQGSLGRLCAKAVNFASAVIWQPLRLAALLRRQRIALVHLNNSIRRNHQWMIAAWVAGVPCITHERGINDHFEQSDRRLGRRLRAVICISEAVAANFAARGITDLRLLTIPNGLDADEMAVTRHPSEVRAELGLPESTPLIGIVGNLKPWKGQAVVIRAMATICKEFTDVRCLLIGDTAPGEAFFRKELDELIREHHLEDRIVITGFRMDVANVLNLLDVQIHASVLPEPFGRVLLEGMALSKPLVAANAGGVPEIVQDGSTGFLFEPDHATALADRVLQLLRDPAKAASMGRAGRRRLETHFSIRQNVAHTEALYQSILETERSPRKD